MIKITFACFESYLKKHMGYFMDQLYVKNVTINRVGTLHVDIFVKNCDMFHSFESISMF